AKEGLQQPRIDSSQEGIFPLTEFSIEQFSNNVLAGKPYSIEVLFMYKGNPGFQTLNKHNFHDALKKIPMVISFDSFINESNIYADLILPLNTFVEEWDEVSAPGVSFQHVGIRNPVVETFYNTKQLPDILLNIGKKLSGTINLYPFSSYKELIQERANKLFLSGAGAVTTEKIGSRWLEFIRVRGWHIGRYESFDEFWKLIVSNGGWWDPSAKSLETNEIFKTRSRKFEFYSTALENTLTAKKVTDERSLNKLNISVRGDTIFMAHHETPPHSENMPLHLIIFRKITNRDGSAANLPLMQEMMGYGIREYWVTWAELNPSTAKKYQIKNNDEIWISSDIGSIKARAKICAGVAEDVVAVPFGLGHTSYGKYANGYGTNPTEIIKNQYDMLSGKPAYLATKVNVSKTIGEV
ncbi:MAG: molybdopterin dinucleotide binding domain-containing protein, partial [Bacteroidota bacterium]